MKDLKQTRIPLTIGVFLLLISLFLPAADISAGHSAKGMMDDHLRTLSSGEKLIYDITWFGISAGAASLEIRDILRFNGREVFHIVSTARSNSYVSLIYPVDDLIETFVDAEGIYPHKISMHKNEGRRKNEKEVAFDQAGHRAREIKDGKENIFDVPPEVQDPLSCLYFFRTFKELNNGKTYTINVFDSKKNWKMEVMVVGREKISVPAGTFDTIKVKPEIYYEGLFQNKGEVYVWLTDDDRRIPVLVKSAIRIGPIKASLVSAVHGEKVAEDLPHQIIPPNPKANP